MNRLFENDRHRPSYMSDKPVSRIRWGGIIVAVVLGAALPFALGWIAYLDVHSGGAVSLYSLPFLAWCVGLGIRLVGTNETKMAFGEKVRVLVGVSRCRTPGDTFGLIFQIVAYLLATVATVLVVFVHDRVLRGGLLLLAGLPALWISSGIVILWLRRQR